MRSPRILSLALSLIAVDACVPTGSVALEPGPGERTLLLVVVDRRAELAGGILHADLIDLGTSTADTFVLPVTFGRELEVLAFYSSLGRDELLLPSEGRDSLEALGLALGPFTEDSQPSRPFPAPRRVRVTGADGVWRDAPQPDELQLRPFDAARCADLGGCIVARDAELCTVPCPGPTGPPSLPFEPAPPALVLRAGCADGTESIEDANGLLLCEPAATSTCAHGALWDVARASCAPTGSICPAGPWSDLAPQGVRLIYVRPGGAAGAGTRASPFNTIARALQAAQPTDVVLLASGQYTESGLVMPPGVSILGACAAATEVRGPDGRFIFRASSPDVALTDLSLVAATGSGLEVPGPGRVALNGVEVRVGGSYGVWVHDGGALSADGLVVSGAAMGLQVESAATATVTRGVLADTVLGGILLRGEGARLRLEHVLASDCAQAERERAALDVLDGASLSADGLLLEGSGARGLRVSGASTAASLRDLVIRDGAPDPGGEASAIRVDRGTLTVERGFFTRATRRTLIGNRAKRLELDYVVVRDVRSPPAELYATGLELVSSEAAISHALLEGATRHGLLMTAGELVLSDSVLRGTKFAEADRGADEGDGLHAEGGALELRRVRFEDHEVFGLHVATPAQVRVFDAQVARTGSPTLAPEAVIGLVTAGGDVTLERVAIDGSTGAGALFGFVEGSRTQVSDLVVRSTAAYGVVASVASATFERVLVDDAQVAGLDFDILAAREPGTINLRAITVRDVHPSALPCPACPTGVGLFLIGIADFVVRDFAVSGCAASGLLVGGLSGVTATDGRVTGNGLGVVFLAPETDPRTVLERVLYDNGAGANLILP